MSVQGRTPLDLLSQELQAYLQAGTQAELFAWGNGANFQLGGCYHAACQNGSSPQHAEKAFSHPESHPSLAVNWL